MKLALTGISAIWITPYGQFSSQLPQPMQVSSMETSPFAVLWMASAGQSLHAMRVLAVAAGGGQMQ